MEPKGKSVNHWNHAIKEYSGSAVSSHDSFLTADKENSFAPP
jgi:hypothetical protein